MAFIIDSIMSDDRNRCMEFGCHGDLTLPGRHVAAKTGTTQVFRDNWTIGFTPSLATVVWVGNPDNQPLTHNSTGIVCAAPIWNQFMAVSLANVPDEWYPPPGNLERIGDDYYLPGTLVLPPILAAPWPVCRIGSYNPHALRYTDLLVDGVPCNARWSIALAAGRAGLRSRTRSEHVVDRAKIHPVHGKLARRAIRQNHDGYPLRGRMIPEPVKKRRTTRATDEASRKMMSGGSARRYASASSDGLATVTW